MGKRQLNTALLRRRITERFGTQSAFAAHCGWSRQYVSRLLSGRTAISAERGAEIAGMLAIEQAALYLENGAPQLFNELPQQREQSPAVRVARAVYVAEPFAAAPIVSVRVEWLPGTVAYVDPVTGLRMRRSTRVFVDAEERHAYVHSLVGKYSALPNDTASFLSRKQEEISREEEQHAVRTRRLRGDRNAPR